MQKAIHPEYHQQITATCSCGATFVFGSTTKSIQTEICSACHPFYTGKQKLVDTAGKVNKFRARLAKAAQAPQGKKKVTAARVNAASKAINLRSSASEVARTVKRVKNAGLKRELKNTKKIEAKGAKQEKGKKEIASAQKD